jgi:NAD(P)-dependent dehydrogenase (short-subunit alcohol dehydrogenase family)
MKNDDQSQPHLASGWNTSRLPDQSGKRFLITGGTSGLGLELAKALVQQGGYVTITARSESKAVSGMKVSGAQDCVALDLADLNSIHAAAKLITSPYDVLFLNAGIMAPAFSKTQDGFESQMGTNHLGHFAFAGLIRKHIRGRLVVTSSLMARMGTFGDRGSLEIRDRCLGIGRYSPWSSYADSKLANLLFVHEMERRRVLLGGGFLPLAAHPGWARTNLFRSLRPDGPAVDDRLGRVQQKLSSSLMGFASRFFSQSAEKGSLPLLCAGTFADLKHTAFFGPDGFLGLKGSPAYTHSKLLAYDSDLAARLWQVSEELTGVRWEDTAHA